MAKDIHAEAFDEGTIQKLEIFEQYTSAWLPTFIMTPSFKHIYIFDFFAGPGYSKTKQLGSPIRILRQIDKYFQSIKSTMTKVTIFLNEYDSDKNICLIQSVNDFIISNAQLTELKERKLLRVIIRQSDVNDLFPTLSKGLGSAPALMFFDQYGVKFLSDEYLLPLLKSSVTDFLFFVSSSYISRFGDLDVFKKYLNIDMNAVHSKPYHFIHRILLDELRSKIPENSSMRLYPFSIKKGSNIYGIIFGTSHIRGANKFLDVAWKENSQNGEANFDIDDEASRCQPNLFSDEPDFAPSLSKIASFQRDLEELILQHYITTNAEAYIYTINRGHIPAHATELVKRLKKSSKITYDGKFPLISYDQVFKNKNILTFQIK